MNVSGLKKDEIEDKNLITLKTYSGIITVEMLRGEDIRKINYNNVNIYENVNESINEINFINSNNLLFVELSDIQPFMINIEKINTLNNYIYSVSFNHSLIINFNINSMVKQFRYDFFVPHSFTYNNEVIIDIYPVSLNISILNNNIHFYITYAFIDNSDNQNNNNTSNNHKHTTSSQDEYMDFSNLNYIDISKEFV